MSPGLIPYYVQQFPSLRKRKTGKRKKKAKQSSTKLEDIFGSLSKMKHFIDATFSAMDKDNNKTIDQEEFKDFLQFLSDKTGTEMPSNEIISKTMRQLDKNEDNKLSLEEITPYVMKLLKD